MQYQYVSLEKATMVQRKHPRDVNPPLLMNIENMVLSRSDNTLTVRPDFDVAGVRVASYESSLELEGSEDDFLNSVTGLYGTDNKVFFTSFFPLDKSNDQINEASQLHSTIICKRQSSAGDTTASVTNGSNEVVLNNDTFNINKKAWPGCVIIFDDDPSQKNYVIKQIVSKTNFLLETAVDFTDASTAFEVLQNHSYKNDGYKYHCEQFLSNLLYNTPHMDDNASLSRITGPWAASIVIFGEEGSFSGTYESIPTYVSSRNVNFDGSSQKNAASGDNIAINLLIGSNETIAYSTDPVDETSWIEFDLDLTGAATTPDPNAAIIWDDTNSKFWVVGWMDDAGDPGKKFLTVWEVTDADPPVSTIHITSEQLTTHYSCTQLCINKEDGELWAVFQSTLANQDKIYKIDMSTFAVSTETLSTACIVTGMEFSATAGSAGQVLVVGNVFDGSNYDKISFLYDCDSDTWGEKNFDENIGPSVHGLGLYDDGTNYCWIVLGWSRIGYWNSDSTTIETTDITVQFEGEDIPYESVSPCVEWTSGGGTEFEKYLLLAGSYNVATLEIDVTNEIPVSLYRSANQENGLSGAGFCAPFPIPGKTWTNRSYMVMCISTEEPYDFWQCPLYFQTEDTFEVESDFLQPLSDIYRSRAYAVLNGYVVMLGVSTYNEDDDVWEYTPRMIRWTAPATVNDFSGVGSGTAEPKGNGEFLDSRSVNGRILTFESNQIGVIIPRGTADDPWDYETLHEGIRSLSNPVTVNDTIYFIASDGLLWMTDGSAVKEAGSSFDLTIYDDFSEDKPVWLTFSEKLNSLLAFYPTGSDDFITSISLANGGVSKHSLQYATDESAEDPKSLVATESCSDIDVFVSHNAESTDTSRIVLTSLTFGGDVTGVDSCTSTDDDYWYAQIETGNCYITPEGDKVDLKHLIVNTYTNASVSTYCPDVVVEVKSTEDSDWHSANDKSIDGHITVDGTNATIPNTDPVYGVFSNYFGDATGSAQTFNVPWIGANCRVYTKSGSTYTLCSSVSASPTVVNTYQVSGTKQIKVLGTAGHGIYIYCENEPAVKAKAGDYIKSDEGYHRITSITNAYAAALDRAKASGSDSDCEHLIAHQMDAGNGEIKIGVNKRVEGVLVRITVLPRHGSGVTGQPSVAKITGVSFAYEPSGKKTLKATGG